jgi:chromosome segregation ATPase
MAAGMSEELAAAQAEVMAEAFVMNVDNLVTKDYLEVCLKALGDRLEARLDEHDRRFEAIEARLDGVDARFDRVDARFDRFDARFDEIDARFEKTDARFDAIEGRFDGTDARFISLERQFSDALNEQAGAVDQRLHTMELEFRGLDARFAEIAGNFRVMFWILGAISATTVVPTLHKLFSGTLFS